MFVDKPLSTIIELDDLYKPGMGLMISLNLPSRTVVQVEQSEGGKARVRVMSKDTSIVCSVRHVLEKLGYILKS